MADTTQIIYCEGEPVALPDYYNNGDITLFSGGLEIEFEGAIPTSTIDQYDIAVDLNTIEFGDLTEPIYAHSGCSNSIDSFFGFQTLNDTPGALNKIDKSSFQIGGNATTFGDLIDPRLHTACVSNGVTGVWAGGGDGVDDQFPIDTLQSLNLLSGGSTTLWGDFMTQSIKGMASGGGSNIYGFIVGGDQGSWAFITDGRRIEYTSGGSIRTWGDLQTAKSYLAGASDNIDIIVAGGLTSETTYSDQIQRFNIANGWDYSNWGNLIQSRSDFGGGGNRVKAIFGGGENSYSGGFQGSIESIEYNSGSAASSYGNLSAPRASVATASGGGGENNPIDYPPQLVNNSGTEGLAVGGQFESVLNHVYINSRSNATNWGELTDTSSNNKTSLSTEDKAIFGVNGGFLEEVQYGSESNSVNFATLIYDLESTGSANNDTIGLTVAGGDRTGDFTVDELTEIIQVNMVSAAIVYDFGDVGPLTMDGLTSVSDGTLCYNIAGYIDDLEGNGTNVITTVPFATGGTVTNFGSAAINRMYFAGASNNTVAMFGGGWDETWDIIASREVFEMASETTSSLVADLVNRREGHFGLGNGYLCLLGGGENPDSDHYLNNEESIEEFSYYNYSSVENFGDMLDPQFSTSSGCVGTSNFVYSETEIVDIIPPVSSPCYKAIMAGGEFGGSYNLKMNLKSDTTSQMYNGRLTSSRFGVYGTSDGVTMLIGGNHYFSSANTGLEYLEFATEADAVIWGYLSVGRTSGSACSDATHSFWVSGDDGGENSIEKIDYASRVREDNFGVVSFIEIGATTTNGTIAICGPVQYGSPDEFRYMSHFITTIGGATVQWGDLTGGRYQTCGIESDTYAVFWAGANWDGPGYATWIDVFEFASQGNATVWGNLDSGREYTDSCEDDVIGLLGTGYAGQHYAFYDQIAFASQGNATHFGDLHTPWDNHHWYACASGGCSVASAPTANCEDLVVFDLYSYIGFHGITFDSNMDDIKLYEAKDRDIDLYLKGIITTDRLDTSIDNLRTLHIDNCLFNAGKTITLKHITDLDIKDLTINTDTIYHDEDFDVMNIEKSRVFILESTINITEQNDNTLNFNSVNFIDTFIKDLNVISVVK